MKKIVAFVMLFLLTVQVSLAQSDVVMADGLYSSGKIYVVVACLAVIVLGMFMYLYSMDKRIKKIENNSQDRK